MSKRTAKTERKTRETEIKVEVSLDGCGDSKVKIDNYFLTHMIETFARYSNMDIKIEAKGEDEHHLVEDVAIALGKTFISAVGNKPIERLGTATVVMDDALVMTSLDIVDRPYCEVDCSDMLYQHFFRSFAMSAGISLHTVVIRGFDDHHIIEAIFKSLGAALKKAIVPRDKEISTKGMVMEK